MDKGVKFVADPHHHILKKYRSSCEGLQFYRLLILHPKQRRLFRGDMDMALSSDALSEEIRNALEPILISGVDEAGEVLYTWTFENTEE